MPSLISSTVRIIFSIIWCLVNVGLSAQIPDLKFTEVVIPGASRLPHIDCIYQDSRGFMWYGTFNGLYLHDGYNLTHFVNDPEDSTSIGDNKIRCLQEDLNGNIWVGTQAGLFLLNTRSYSFTKVGVKDSSGIGRFLIDFLARDMQDNIWIGAVPGLFCVNSEIIRSGNHYIADRTFKRVRTVHFDLNGDLWATDRRRIYRKKNREKNFEAIEVVDKMQYDTLMYSMIWDQSDMIWIIGSQGIYKYSPQLDSILLFQKWKLTLGPANWIREALVVNDLLIVPVEKGLLRLDLNTLEFARQAVDLKDPLNQSKNFVQTMFMTQQEELWIGGDLGWPYYCDFGNDGIQNCAFEPFKVVSGPGNIYELYEYRPGWLLIPDKQGLRFLNPYSGSHDKFPFQPPYNPIGWETGVQTFCEFEERLWMGTASGLFLFNKATQTFEEFERDITGIEILRDFSIRDLFMDSQNNLWIATWNTGLYKIDFALKNLIQFEIPGANSYSSNLSCRFIYEDRKNQIWIGTRTGLLKYVDSTDSFISYQHDPDDPTSMSENTSFCIYEDSLGFIWSGSYGGGLNRLDQATGRFRHFTTHDGLLNNNIFSLLPDYAGDLWMASYDGITRFNPYTFRSDNFTHENGLGSTSYDAFIYGKSPYTGDLFFGGKQGIDIIRPDSIRLSDYKPKVVFTDFQLFNESLPIKGQPKKNDAEFYLNQHISWTKEVVLNHNQRVFTIQYAALDFSGPENIQYAYQLAGFDSDWQFVDKKRTATYTNLDPGKYEFKVKSTNADGIWNENYSSLALIITPPWWDTWWAYLIYALLFSGILLLTYYYQKRRWALQTALQLQQHEAVRLKDLDILKTNLYTNITHEFRTPLTVITGMTEMIRTQPKAWLEKGTSLIEQHSQKLLQMVNQMLDLQKLEAGRMEIKLIHADVISFINYMMEPFQFQAEAKGLNFEVSHQQLNLTMDFDPEKLAMIISNLLSNAIKFTERGGISIHTEILSDAHLAIIVRDSGIGIPEDKTELIFDRFYQAEQGSTRQGEGSGIGLALVRELVQIMGGQIEVESTPDHGSIFRVQLNIRQEASPPLSSNWLPETPGFPLSNEIIDSLDGSGGSEARILIIEDHADVRRYLRALLQSQYKIDEAANGEIGIQLSRELVPDLIICDVMMPGKDGYEVCDDLHKHSLTTHIPIILLTAKADLQSRVEGLHRGADAYLAKPFRSEELRAQISMLLEQRKRLQKKIRDRMTAGFHPDNEIVPDPFLASFTNLILSELSNEELDIKEICKRMHVSRSQLHNKIKGTTGFSTNIFIRKIRLGEARKLIRTTALPISEIAYSAGFKDPNFFSRVYKKEFGESPKEGREKLN